MLIRIRVNILFGVKVGLEVEDREDTDQVEDLAAGAVEDLVGKEAAVGVMVVEAVGVVLVGEVGEAVVAVVMVVEVEEDLVEKGVVGAVAAKEVMEVGEGEVVEAMENRKQNQSLNFWTSPIFYFPLLLHLKCYAHESTSMLS